MILVSIVLGGGSFIAFFDAPSMMVVIGGAIAATLISFPLPNFLSVFGVALKTLMWKVDSPKVLIEQIVSLAETARKEGLLALEGRSARSTTTSSSSASRWRSTARVPR